MPPLVFIHVVVSLLGIGSGILDLLGFFGNKRLDAWTHFFLVTTILTRHGFILPAHKILPAHVLSLIALAIACVSRCSKKMQGSWLKSYVSTAMISLQRPRAIAQSFMKSSRAPRART
jgi:hypothetical protein